MCCLFPMVGSDIRSVQLRTDDAEVGQAEVAAEHLQDVAAGGAVSERHREAHAALDDDDLARRHVQEPELRRDP